MSPESSLGRFFRAIDERDWTAVRAGLADDVTTDYTELFGGDIQHLSADDLVDQWAAMLPGFDATQHLVGPLLEGESDRYEANVRGYHHLGGETWMVAGWYVLDTVPSGAPQGAVRLSGITLHVSYETGPRELVERARARAATT